jgi:hypothetical protein
MGATLGHFGDFRRERTGAALLAALVSQPRNGIALAKLAGGRRAQTMRFSRFLHCPATTLAEMVATAAERTARACAGRHILVVQDTTSVREYDAGTCLAMHAAVAFDAADGSVVGIVGASFWRRRGGKRAECGKRPFDGKESRRWLDVAEAARKLLDAGAAGVTVVADRECDIYDVFARCPPGVALVVRLSHDRKLGDTDTVSSQLAAQPSLGRETVAVPRCAAGGDGAGKKSRPAVLSLRGARVFLRRPMRNRAAMRAGLPETVEIGVVEAREARAPKGREALCWQIYTTDPGSDLAWAKRTLALYRFRWNIEQVFRAMKTEGFDVEDSCLPDGGPLEKMAFAVLAAAVAVMQLVRARDGAGGRPASDVFDPEEQTALVRICPRIEGKTAKLKNPHPPRSLAWAAWT